MKKVLIVCKGFYPEQSPRAMRATELAKELVKQGHEVTVLTYKRDFDYSDFLRDNKIRIENFGRLRWKQFRKSNWKLVGDLKRKFGRLLYMLLYYPDIEIMIRLKKALKFKRGYDLMISIAVPYPIHWGVAWSRTPKNKIAKTWVADCGDPFMGVTLESFRFPFYFAKVEKWFCHKADYLTVPTKGAIEAYYPEFHHKIKTIPQGFNFDNINLAPSSTNNVPTFAYAGGVSLAGVRNPIKTIQYLLNQDIEFIFYIYATNNSQILIEYENNSKGRIKIQDPLPRNALLYELSKMDFLINFDNGTPHQTPSKLIDYAIVQKPILNLQAENPDYAVISKFLKGDYTNSLKIFNIHNYNIQNVTHNFLALADNNA